MNPKRANSVLMWTVLAWLLMAAVCAQGQGLPPAGVTINVRAAVQYQDPQTGFYGTMYSNYVETTILPLEGVLLTSDRFVKAPPGGAVYLPHRFTNTGNVTTTYKLTANPVAGSDFDLSSVTVWRDVNGNGMADPGEPVVSVSTGIVLAPGEWADVVIGGIIPPTAPLGSVGRLMVKVVSQVQAASLTNTDTVTVTGGAAIDVHKDAVVTSPLPGSEEEFRLTARSTGNASAEGVAISIDGASATNVVIRDDIPVNTTFLAITASGGGKPLYHKLGEAADAYRTVAPADLSQVDAVAWAFQAPVSPGWTLGTGFKVLINSNATGLVTNTAFAKFADAGKPQSSQSNTVQLALPTRAPEIHFYTDAGFGTTALIAKVGAALFVQANAAACNVDPHTAETHTITLTSRLTGDVESLLGTETTANSGIFRITPNAPTRDGRSNPVVSGNLIVETVPTDTLTARMEGCGATAITSSVMVDPGGVVFDARTNQPIPSTRVTLIDVTGNGNGGNPNGPATVYDVDGVTTISATVTTGIDGSFQFPLVKESTYRLQIVTPNGFAFPSTVPYNLLPPNRNVHPTASYGGDFAVTALGPVTIDIPLDPAAASGLFVEKTASRQYVEIGEFVDYEVKVKNASGLPMVNITVEDNLPAGFAYQKGTARLDAKAMAEPVGAPGPRLQFAVATLEAGKTASVTYRLKVGAGAQQGNGINRAIAHTGPTSSNVASVKVKLLDNGAFSTKGYVLGSVKTRCSTALAATSKGVPGVRIYLEDGTFSITDGEGFFSFYGVTAATHVLKLDQSTLPMGATLLATSNRQALRPSTRFVDVQMGSLEKTDFYVDACSGEVAKSVDARAESYALGRSELDNIVKKPLLQESNVHSDTERKGLPASGIVDGGANEPSAKAAAAQKGSAGKLPGLKLAADAGATAKTPANGTKELAVPQFDASKVDSKLGFLDVADETVLTMDQLSVLVKGRTGGSFRLSLNGETVSDKRVGYKTTLNDKGVDVWQYVGLQLNAGRNKLKAELLDPWKNVRESAELTVIAPGKPAKLVLTTAKTVEARDDGRPVKVEVQLTDENGVPVTYRVPITLEATDGTWKLDDFDPNQPGIQTFIEGGKAEFPFAPPSQTGSVQLKIAAGAVSAQEKIDVVPALRPMLAAGVVDFKFDFANVDTRRLSPTRLEDGFEQSLHLLAVSSDDGKMKFGGRTGVLIKGAVRNNYLLTLAYNSEKSAHDVLFRDIQPDEFYPAYGDSSTKGYDAQSSGKLYVRLDKGKNFLLFGDYMTNDTSSGSRRVLSNYMRSLNGFKQHWEGKHLNQTVFSSYDSVRQMVQEIPGNGTSGPYMLNTINALVNSEKVELVVRDRNQPSLVLQTIPQTRFSDYAFEAYTGRLLFKSPVATLDGELNPVYIRVTFEVDNGGERFWVSGLETQFKFGKAELGFNFVDDKKPENAMAMLGVNAAINFTPRTVLAGEVVGTDTDMSGRGLGYRMEFQHKGSKLDANMYFGRTQQSFDNPSATLAKGRGESGLKLNYKIAANMRLKGEFLRTEDVSVGGARTGMLASVERTLPHRMILEAGYRHSEESTAASSSSSQGTTPNSVNTMRVKMTAPAPWIRNASLFGEYEQDPSDFDKKLAALGGKYQISEKNKVYVRHEFISSVGGVYALNTSQSQNATVVGIESDEMKSSHVFGEYRVHNAFAGREAEAAMGLRNTWQVTKGLRFSSSLESVRAVTGPGTNESLALTGGTEYTANDNWKTTARLEWRGAAASNAFLSTVGVAAKVSRDWTLLGRNLLATVDAKGKPGDRLQNRTQFGMAFRDHEDNRWSALTMFEFKRENDEAATLANDRTVGILSAHMAYQPIEKLVLSARYAGKIADEKSSGIATRSSANLLGWHATYDLAKRVDIGISANTMFSHGFANRQYGLGSEVGYLLGGNVWISAGYNLTGFTDRDLTQEDYTKRGGFVRLRLKFDEETLRSLGLLRKLMAR